MLLKEINYYGLESWWKNELTNEEREEAIHKYKPLGSENDSEDEIIYIDQTKIKFLYNLSGYFKGILAKKIILRAESCIDSKTSATDLHFLYQHKLKIFYYLREQDPKNLDIAIEACKKQISYGSKAIKEILKLTNGYAPSHVGFKQLSIIYEKQKKYEEAIKLCEKAKAQGWDGDWDKRIERCKKKI